MSLEYLSVEPAPRPRWHWIVGSAVAIVLVTALGALWWSGHVRERANIQLEASLVRANSDAHGGEAVVLSVLQYSSPTIWSTMVGEDVRASLRGLVQRSAAQVVRTLDDTKASVDGTFVLPWDSGQREAKDAVRALVDAHRARFEQIAADATAIGAVFSSPAPSDTTARALLRASGAITDDGD